MACSMAHAVALPVDGRVERLRLALVGHDQRAAALWRAGLRGARAATAATVLPPQADSTATAATAKP